METENAYTASRSTAKPPSTKRGVNYIIISHSLQSSHFDWNTTHITNSSMLFVFLWYPCTAHDHTNQGLNVVQFSLMNCVNGIGDFFIFMFIVLSLVDHSTW